MKKLGLTLAAAGVAAMFGGISAAQAHTPAKCKKELQQFASMCKFSPSMLILGLCKNKKAQKWCYDKKLHDEKFHK